MLVLCIIRISSQGPDFVVFDIAVLLEDGP